MRVPSIKHGFTLASASSPSLSLSWLLPLAQYRFKCLRIYSGARWEKESKFVNLMNGTSFLKTAAPQPPRVQLSSFSSLISDPHREGLCLKRKTPDSSFSGPGFKWDVDVQSRLVSLNDLGDNGRRNFLWGAPLLITLIYYFLTLSEQTRWWSRNSNL